jgi:hypothetical protein
MPSAKEHLEQYKKNKASLEKIMRIDKPPYDWVVTIAFYAAVHLIEKFIVEKHPTGKASSDHNDRMQWVTMIAELKPIRSFYSALSQSSWQSRYMCIPFDQENTNKTILHLEKIEQALLKK